MSARRSVHVVVPDGIDDPTRPSGGNTYDRRVCDALAAADWSVRTRLVAGDRPRAADAGGRALIEVLDDIADGSVVLVDGLVASTAPDVMVPSSARLRLVVLVHLPIGSVDGRPGRRGRERAVLRAARAVVTTSAWSRGWLLAAYDLDPARVHVARPGVAVAEPATVREDGSRLLCVGAVTPVKGHDVLLAALAQVADQPWRCACVGSLTRAPEFVTRLRGTLRDPRLRGRVDLPGPRTGRELDEAYAAADVLLLASRAEAFGMVVTEALTRGLPVLASDVGGIPEALGRTTSGRRPGLLTLPGDADSLAAALRRWLGEPDLRRDLRAAARERRSGLAGWTTTTERIARVLEEVAR